MASYLHGPLGKGYTALFVTIHAVNGSDAGEVWDDTANAFETWSDGSLGDYDVTGSQLGTSGIWRFAIPSDLTSGDYEAMVFSGTASDGIEDCTPIGSSFAFTWDGTNQCMLGGSPLYHAAIQFIRDQADTYDRYWVSWFKNGTLVTSGITSPTMTVRNLTANTTLLSGVTITVDANETGSYEYSTNTGAERLATGDIGSVTVTATIDGASRTFRKAIGRDSA